MKPLKEIGRTEGVKVLLADGSIVRDLEITYNVQERRELVRRVWEKAVHALVEPEERLQKEAWDYFEYIIKSEEL